jgi:DNA-binding LacI/PurR family transcriptional regulator
MKSVAVEAGVSVMTVSRALRNQPSLPETTRRRIQKLARQMGYRPNPLVSTLMAQLRGSRPRKDGPTICFLTAYPDPGHWKDLYYNVDAFHGAAARAEELGYHFEHFCLTESGMTFQRASRILRTQGVAGLLIAPLPYPPPEKFDIRWEWFACADVGSSLKHPHMHRTMVDHYSAMRLTYRSLRDLGYRRIGFAARPMDDNVVDNKWVAGFLTEQFFALPENQVPPMVEADWRKETFLRWFEKNRPDAIITMHVQVKDWLQEIGLGVPQDIGVAMPDISYRKIYPGLSGVDQRTELVGSMGIDLVVEQINNNERGVPRAAKIVMVNGIWVQGEYVRPQKSCPLPLKK